MAAASSAAAFSAAFFAAAFSSAAFSAAACAADALEVAVGDAREEAGDFAAARAGVVDRLALVLARFDAAALWTGQSWFQRVLWRTAKPASWHSNDRLCRNKDSVVVLASEILHLLYGAIVLSL